jgi:xylan 1,4-beta-xylosidase
VHRQAGGRPVHYTEWNTSSNPRDPLHDEPYAAAFVVKTIMEASGLVAGYSFWTYTDIFAENYFPSMPFHGGFGLLNLHGIAKPTYRAFQLLHRLGTDRLPVEGRHTTVDAWIVRDSAAVVAVLTNHALPRHPIETHNIRARLAGVSKPRSVVIERIDDRHGNAKRRWLEMGEPKYLSAGQQEDLEEASRTTKEELPWKLEDQSIELNIELPPHAVALVTVELMPGNEAQR